MQCTSYFSNPTEQALLTLQLREASLRVAREELAFLQACGGVGAEDVRRLRVGLGMVDSLNGAAVVDNTDVVVVEEDGAGGVVVKKEPCGELVSLKSILLPLATSDISVTRLCRMVRPLLERHGVATFKRHKVVHVLRSQAVRVRDVGGAVRFVTVEQGIKKYS